MPDTPASAPARGTGLHAVPVELRVTVGSARPTIADFLNLSRDAVLPLDRRLDDPVELYVGDRLIARGELVEQDGNRAGQLAVRLTEIVDPGDAS